MVTNLGGETLWLNRIDRCFTHALWVSQTVAGPEVHLRTHNQPSTRSRGIGIRMTQSTLVNFFATPSSSVGHVKSKSTSSPARKKLSKDKRLSSHNGDDPSTVPGLSVIPDFITPTLENNLLQFLDAQQWRTDLARRTMHFGGTYCLMTKNDTPGPSQAQPKPEIIQAPPIPPQFTDLLQLFFESGIYDRHTPPEYCIVNEYKDAHGISAHVENFTFGEPVCSLSLHDGDLMRFHELESAHDGSVRSGKSRLARRTGKKVDVWLPPRSLVVLRGDARSRWQHEITRSRTGRVSSHPGEEWKRTSLTFRVKR